jgi:hypothetical protein
MYYMNSCDEMDILDIMVLKYVVYQCISIYEYQNLGGKRKGCFGDLTLKR